MPFGFLRPVGPRGFDFVEVGMWVPLDGLFLVEALLVAGRVLLALLFVAEIGGHGGVVECAVEEGPRGVLGGAGAMIEML